VTRAGPVSALETVACNLCGSTRARRSLVGADVRCRTPGRFTVVTCRECGLSYVSPRPPADQIGRHYPAHYGEHGKAHWGNTFATTEAAIVDGFFDAPGSVLDVGCAAGGFLLAMRERGWRVAGVDTSEAAHHLAALVPDADVRLGTLGKDMFPAGSFDAVTLWSVLEHLHDPRGVLTAVREVVKPGGRVFLVVPNYQSLERRLFRTRWFGLDLPRHLYQFSPATIRRMLATAGFQVESLDHASGHDGVRWSLRLLARKPLPGEPGPADDGLDQPMVGARFGANAGRSLKRAVVGGITTVADRAGMGAQLFVVARPVRD
jgi:2-polyprenyl-3-methyl-5-hydroxy-6-metoxy-1,4-benzoquinol methylase